jgi:hypothetical protein
VENSGTDFAVADLANRLDLHPSAIEVVSIADVTWSDGSIGCPQPGMAYTQALVPGSLIILAFEGTTYEYHGAGDQPPFFCPPERVRPPTGLADPDT